MALEQNGRADAAAFIRWRWRNRLSLSKAAETLGLSRRMVAYYEGRLAGHLLGFRLKA